MVAPRYDGRRQRLEACFCLPRHPSPKIWVTNQRCRVLDLRGKQHRLHSQQCLCALGAFVRTPGPASATPTKVVPCSGVGRYLHIVVGTTFDFDAGRWRGIGDYSVLQLYEVEVAGCRSNGDDERPAPPPAWSRILPRLAACAMENRTMQEIVKGPGAREQGFFRGGLGGKAQGNWRTVWMLAKARVPRRPQFCGNRHHGGCDLLQVQFRSAQLVVAPPPLEPLSHPPLPFSLPPVPSSIFPAVTLHPAPGRCGVFRARSSDRAPGAMRPR